VIDAYLGNDEPDDEAADEPVEAALWNS